MFGEMMEFVFDAESGWAAAAVISALLFGVLVFMWEALVLSYEKGYRINRPSFYVGWSITLIVLYAVANGIVALGSSSSTPNANATSVDMAAYFGLESGKEYPLILGDEQGSGIVGTAEVSAGLFAANAAIDLRPTSTVSVGFQKEDSWWQLTLPTTTATFKKGAEEPTVRITLNNEAFIGGSPATWKQTWSDCTWQLHNLWFVCEKTITSRELVLTDQAEAEGLANIVSQYLQSAEIRLTNEQHAKLFPTN